MLSSNTYLNFSGNTEEAFNFYKSVFGGEFTALIRFKETPDGEKIPPGDRNKIMHVELPLGKNNFLMGTDALESMGHKLTIGNNFSVSVNAESKEEADKLFKGLSDGGKVNVKLTETFWGAYWGMLTDKFNIQWMISFDKNHK